MHPANNLKSTLCRLLFISLPMANVVAGNEIPEPVSPPQPLISKQVMLAKTKLIAEQEQKVLKEADEVVVATNKALMAIENTDIKRAKLLLHEASTKIESLLRKQPDIAVVAANVDTDVVEFEGDANAAKKAVESADDLLDDGHVQEARQMLSQLQSEVRLTTTSLPLKSFPKALKEADVYLQQGKYNEAASAVYDMLHTLVVTTDIVPLPIMNAELFLSDAAELEHKQGLSTEQHRAEVLKLTNAAHEQLKLAQVLGYGDKNDYKTLYTALEELNETVNLEKTASVWSNLKSQVHAIKEKLMHRVK